MQQRSTGLLYGGAAYLFWGIIPIFWRELAHVPALEILAHRVVWALPVLLAILIARARLPEFRAACASDSQRSEWCLWAAGTGRTHGAQLAAAL